MTAMIALAVFGAGPANAGGVESSAAGVSYTWVGSYHHSGGDNHSWTDPQNWAPQGVPADGDSASVAPTAGECKATVRGLPDGLTLVDFSLSVGTKCFVIVKGGSLKVTGTLDWQSGRIAVDLSLARTGVATLSGDPGGRTFTGSFDVYGTLALYDATITQAGHEPLRLESGASLDGGGTVNGSLINRGGTIYVGRSGYNLGVTGDFLESAAGTLSFYIFLDGPIFGVGGTSTVNGTVIFDTLYSPSIGQRELPMSSQGLWTWQPSCHTTTGQGSDTAHWKTKPGTYLGGGFLKVQWHDGAAKAC